MNDPPKERPKLWWAAVIACSAAFVVASLAYMAAGFGDRDVPANQFLNQHGGKVIGVLAALTIGSGVLAMYLDQRDRRSTESDRAMESDTVDEDS